SSRPERQDAPLRFAERPPAPQPAHHLPRRQPTPAAATTRAGRQHTADHGPVPPRQHPRAPPPESPPQPAARRRRPPSTPPPRGSTPPRPDVRIIVPVGTSCR